jgi:chromosome segregation ATPase
MARRSVDPRARIASLEGQIERLARAIDSVEARLAVERDRAKRMEKELASHARREKAVLTALRLSPRSKAGAKGRLGELEATVVGLQEYLLRTSDRIDKILTALKEHREFLGEIDRRVVQTGTRERIRLELDVMKNTLSILALAGVEVDDALPRDIERLRANAVKDDADLSELRRTKDALDKRFDEELKRFDLETIWSKKREIPGYR